MYEDCALPDGAMMARGQSVGAARAKSLFIKTYGCQMNVYDSARMADVLAPLGYCAVDGPDGADMVILNTCHIREKATEKIFSELGRLRSLQMAAADEGRCMLLAVAGCVAQAEGEEITRRAPYVDLVFGPQTYHRLPQMVARALAVRESGREHGREHGAENGGEHGGENGAGNGAKAGRKRGRKTGAGIVDTTFPAESKFDFLPTPNTGPASAFLTVQEGCDKFCSFCVVPYTRGAEVSRPAAHVIAEARHLVAGGASEIALLGQNVNAWHGEAAGGQEWSLGRLIFELAEIDGLRRIRYMTSHPRDMDAELIAAHADVPALAPWLHLPVQSGSDRILRAMNRRHDRDDYLRLIEKLRHARPDLALSSDFIVGHPGESDADFADTLRLVNEIGYAQAYSFKYSPRPGTPAANLEPVPDPVSADRLQSLQQVLNAQQLAFNQAAEGTRQMVLVERKGHKPGQWLGRGPYMQMVHFEGPQDEPGTTPETTPGPAPGPAPGPMVTLDIEKGLANSLSGRLVSAAPNADQGPNERVPERVPQGREMLHP